MLDWLLRRRCDLHGDRLRAAAPVGTDRGDEAHFLLAHQLYSPNSSRAAARSCRSCDEARAAGPRLLVEVKEAFPNSGGTLVMPGVESASFPRDERVILRHPDGRARETTIRCVPEPIAGVRTVALVLPEVHDSEVPIGSQIWCDRAAIRSA